MNFTFIFIPYESLSHLMKLQYMKSSTCTSAAVKVTTTSDNYTCPLRSLIILTSICTKEASMYSTRNPLRYRIIINTGIKFVKYC